MKIYKSYYTGRGKNTNKFFFTSSLVFSAKKFTIVLLETPSISNKFVLQMILVLLLYLLFFFTIKFVVFVAMNFFFVFLLSKICFVSLPSKQFFFVSLPSKKIYPSSC